MRTKSPTPPQTAHTPGFQDESAPRNARQECVANYRKYLRNPKSLSHYTHTHTLAFLPTLPAPTPLPQLGRLTAPDKSHPKNPHHSPSQKSP
jgi:hypothetical protein